jgi:hypothetical protein
MVGRWQPYDVRVFQGPAWTIPRLMMRRLEVDMDSSSRPRPKMWKLQTQPQAYSYEPYATSPRMVMAGRFSIGTSPRFDESMVSRMEYPQHGLILEWVKDIDESLNYTSDSMVPWRKI